MYCHKMSSSSSSDDNINLCEPMDLSSPGGDMEQDTLKALMSHKTQDGQYAVKLDDSDNAWMKLVYWHCYTR